MTSGLVPGTKKELLRYAYVEKNMKKIDEVMDSPNKIKLIVLTEEDQLSPDALAEIKKKK